jgi:hypothetical protein
MITALDTRKDKLDRPTVQSTNLSTVKQYLLRFLLSSAVGEEYENNPAAIYFFLKEPAAIIRI